jgi:membrane protease YdiL (CAAX protease family)
VGVQKGKSDVTNPWAARVRFWTAIISGMSLIRNTLKNFWTRDSSILLGGFLLTIFLIIYVWWPLAEEYFKYVDWNGPWWRYMDWLLLGIFGFMSGTIIARESQSGFTDHLRRSLRWACDRIVGHTDRSLP